MADLGKRIQELRKENGFTQQELAKKINISHPQIVRYENKGVQPPADVLARIADIFDVSIDYLVNGDKSNRAEQTLKDAELIKQFKQLDQLPDDEKNSILKVVNALIRDFKTKQAYSL
jgi:transcriptional regulator with XRE-family HTH domain